MTTQFSSWLVLLLAFFFANAPFLNHQLLLVIPIKKGLRKPFWVSLVEVFVGLLIVLSLGFALETKMGNAFQQTWEFYAVMIMLMLVFAFPGFVYRYLLRR